MGDLPEIEFDYFLFPDMNITVLANSNGTGILVLDKHTDSEIEWDSISEINQGLIKLQVMDWVSHYAVMRNEPHPADDAFGVDYVRGLNSDMGRR